MSSYYSSLDWVLSHWAHFTVRRFICVCVYFVCFCFILHSCCIIVSTVGWTWWDWSLILWTCLPSVLWHCWLGHLTRKKFVPDMTYNVFDETLNLTLLLLLLLLLFLQVDKMVEETLSETQCDSCFETATSARALNGVCVVSPAVVHCVDCVQNLCISCCSRLCKLPPTHDDVRCFFLLIIQCN